MNLPNKLTILRVIMIPFFVAALLYDGGANQNMRYVAAALFIIASLTDMLDGKIARKYNLVTNFGKFMDPLADKLLVCSALICMIGLVVGSVFGIFAPNPDNENGITIVQTVREANAEYEAQIAEIKSRYDYDMCFVSGEPCEWSLAIAVYAVETNRTEDVVTFDEAKAAVLKEVYRSLNRMDIHTEQITVKETRLETQEDGSVVPVEQEVVKTYLYIETVPLTAEEAANLYCFDTKQREQLGELLSDRNKEMWDGLLS